MPLYTFRCGLCDRSRTTYRSVEDRHRQPTCPDCDEYMDRRWHPVRFNMPKLNFQRKVEENRKRFQKVGVPEPEGKEEGE